MGGTPPQYPQQPQQPQQPQYPQQQYPQQPQYPPGQYGQPPYQAGPKTNGLAIASLILGILWVCFVGSILALIFGYMARKQIKESGGTQQGDGMALAGIILGWIGVAFLVLDIILVITGATTFTFETT